MMTKLYKPAAAVKNLWQFQIQIGCGISTFIWIMKCFGTMISFTLFFPVRFYFYHFIFKEEWCFLDKGPQVWHELYVYNSTW